MLPTKLTKENGTMKKDKKTDPRNKSATAVAESLAARMGDDGYVTLEEIVETTILALFFIQKLGKASLDQVTEAMDGIKARVDRHLLEQACEALRARKMASVSSGRGPAASGGESIRMYRIRDISFSSTPETAHVKDLLPGLVATPEGQLLIDAMNELEEDGDGTKKAKTRLGYTDYVVVKATFVTINDITGSQPSSPYLDRLVKMSSFPCPKEAELRFDRHANGDIKIGSDVIRGWLRNGLRTKRLGEAAAQYIGVNDVRIVPKQKVEQVKYPVIDAQTGRGAGCPTYELIPAGEHIELTFTIPTKGLFTAEKFKLFLAGYGPNPTRGLSPSRGAKNGKVALIKFEELGKTEDDRAVIDSVMDLIPEEARAFYEQLLVKA